MQKGQARGNARRDGHVRCNKVWQGFTAVGQENKSTSKSRSSASLCMLNALTAQAASFHNNPVCQVHLVLAHDLRTRPHFWLVLLDPQEQGCSVCRTSKLMVRTRPRGYLGHVGLLKKTQAIDSHQPRACAQTGVRMFEGTAAHPSVGITRCEQLACLVCRPLVHPHQSGAQRRIVCAAYAVGTMFGRGCPTTEQSPPGAATASTHASPFPLTACMQQHALASAVATQEAVTSDAPSSSATTVQHVVSIPTARTLPAGTSARATAPRTAAPSAVHQSSGACSAHPGRGNLVW
eukprot:364938-Chlamydomonas_euryale.AAC.33